jgi:cell division protein FtsB
MAAVFILRRGLFGYRRRDVLAALDEQRRQIETLAATVDGLWQEKDRAWRANHAVSRELIAERSRNELQRVADRSRVQETATSARLDDISAKLDELLVLRDRLAEPAHEPVIRAARTRPPIFVSEVGELGTVLQRRIARRV